MASPSPTTALGVTSTSTPTTVSTLTLEQVLNAEENLSLMELALQDIRRLMEEKELLRSNVETLQKEKAELMGKGQNLRRSSAVARKSLVVAKMNGRRASLIQDDE